MKKQKWAWVVTAACALLYVLNILASSGIYDASDGLAHFTIAHYAPKHPELFLDHWGKPLFTILASPFTHFGIKGVMAFNTLLYVLTAFFIVKLASTLQLRFTWILPLLLAAIPVYFQVVMSGLTEVLFAAVFVAGLWAFATNRFVIAALIITWLPFARSEAYFIVPLFALAFISRRQIWPLLLLAVGPIIMSIIGWFVFKDLLWIIHNNPYTGAKDIYGSGNFWHFYHAHSSITGAVMFFTAIAGMVIALWNTRKSGLSARHVTVMLMVLSLLSVFIGHSYFWANGLYGSLGLLRVLATVAPLFALFSLYFVSEIASRMIKPVLVLPVVLLLAASTLVALRKHQTFGLKPFGYELLANDLATWYKKSEFAGNPNVWFMHPLVGYFLDIDDRDPANSSQLWNLNRITPSNSIRENGLIIWEAQHAPNEGGTSTEALQADRHLQLATQIVGADVFGSAITFDVYVKKTKSDTDTLVFENFTATRPILSGRLKQIGTDSLGKPYFDMVNTTNYLTVYTFWAADKAVWQAPAFNFSYTANTPLEVWLAVQKNDGTTQMMFWAEGTFSLPEITDDIRNISIALRNPQPDVSVRLYNFGLTRLHNLPPR